MVTKKRAIKKNSKNTFKINKNLLSIIFGSISILGVAFTFLGILLISPFYFSLSGVIGLILAYVSKNSTKLNKWGFYLSIIGIILSFIFFILVLYYLNGLIQSIQ